MDILTPLAEAALSHQLNREQMLRRAMQEGTAVLDGGRWYVRSVAEHDRNKTEGSPTSRDT